MEPAPPARTVLDAEGLLERLGAPLRLLRHVRLVGEAGEQILSELERRRVPLDPSLVRLGIVFHDAGKILHQEELDGPGDLHEPDGERLLLEHGVEARVARCCMSHARWQSMECSLEELLVALADKLWKGVRNAELERAVIERVAAVLGKDVWDLFVDLDSCFEEIAATGSERLERSG
jgi:HD domain